MMQPCIPFNLFNEWSRWLCSSLAFLFLHARAAGGVALQLLPLPFCSLHHRHLCAPDAAAFGAASGVHSDDYFHLHCTLLLTGIGMPVLLGS
eukprot:9654694-Prorocentrum_lima.AAC.1